mgnify:CR=1 FL=1
MKTTQIIAITLAGSIGIMSIISGLSVLLGLHEVEYMVLNALVVYNVVVGALSVSTAFLIRKNFMLSKNYISLILIFHASVLAFLYFFSETVAMESIKAMTFRVGIWLLIFILVLPRQSKKQLPLK